VPLYEYQCQKCRHRFEKIQKFSDAPLKKCPECGGKLEKLITAPAVHFKGSGFYGTDYKKSSGDGGSGSSSAKSSEDSGASASTESSASEAKPKKEPSEKKAGKK
jgi:putative FmdB family regulatory protein